MSHWQSVQNAVSYTHLYQKLFDFDNIQLELTDDALTAVATEAIARKTGARGLRSIMEATLMDSMYTTPCLLYTSRCV